MIGFNPEEVEKLSTQISNAAANVGKDITDKLREGIIVPISTTWYAPEAVQFFEEFKKTVDGCGSSITEAFDSFRQSVEAAGNEWADNTNGTTSTNKVTLAEVKPVVLNLIVSDIQAQENGNVYIIPGEARSVANKLGAVQEDIKAALKSRSTELQAETAFLGGKQAEALSECFLRVNEIVADIFKFLTEGDVNLASEINKAAEKYEKVAEDVASEYSNAATGSNQ